MKRKIYNQLLKWKENNITTPLMIIGARQVGKTYIINEFCKKEFDNYIYLNLFEEENIVELFSRKISITEKMQLFKIIIKNTRNIDIDFKNTLIFFDEIQESEDIISYLKYFNESEIPYKIICAGSLLGVKINRMEKSFPVGKVEMLYMYPMDFEEFLMAISDEKIIDIIKDHYNTNTPMVDIIHDELMSLYRLYLCVGGMPASIENIINVQKDILKYNKTILKQITIGYISDMKKYIKDATEATRIECLYKSIPTQIGNKSNKFQFSNIKNGARMKNYESALSWLLSSKLIIQICSLNNAQIPPEAFKIENIFKLYLNDVGILNSILQINLEDIILNNDFIFKGIIAENYVIEQLQYNFENVYYWKNDNTAEVDFIIYNRDGLIPIEVKAGDSTLSKSLNLYMQKFKSKYAIKICSKNFGYANNIKTIPLYAAFCIS